MDNTKLAKKFFNWDYSQRNSNWCHDMAQLFESLDMADIYHNVIECDLTLVRQKISDLVKTEWLESVQAKPKLRTYKLFKTNCDVENYITACLPRRERSLLAQFRLGILPLRIETGRWRKVRDAETGKYRGLEVQERICELCQNGVEDEQHFLCLCPTFDQYRQELYTAACEHDSLFLDYSIEGKFIFLLTTCWRNSAKFLSVAWLKRQNLLYRKVN